MSEYTATIRDGDEILLDCVTVYVVEVKEPSGLRSWRGTFQLSPGQNIELGGPFGLELDDARRGRILITRIAPSSDSPTQVSFIGTGPLS